MKKSTRKKSQKSTLIKLHQTPAVRKGSKEINRLYQRVHEILNSARQQVDRSINSEMVQAYWLIGQAIVEQEQKGKKRAGYGEQLIEALSQHLKAKGISGFSKNNLWYMRQFYMTFPEKLHA